MISATRTRDLEIGARPAPRPALRLNGPRLTLVMLDATALTLAWALAVYLGTGPLGLSWGEGDRIRMLAVPALSIGLTWALMVLSDLYKSRVGSFRSAELAAIWRVTSILTPSVPLVDVLVTGRLHIAVDLLAVGLTLVLLVTARSVFDSWIRAARAEGRFCRPVVVVGAGPASEAMMELLSDHVEAGYHVMGAVGRAPLEGSSLRWLGPVDNILAIMDSVGANGAFLVIDDLTVAQRAFAVETLTSAGHHVHMTMGVPGIVSQRVQLAPVAHEPLLYVEQPALDRWQTVAKRSLDISLASVALLLTAPLLALAGLVIFLQDRGPVFFRQERVGLQGRPFVLWKLRTMAVDAESRAGELTDLNERQGPLLKVAHDPRVTRFGRLLRSSSIDELPQLWNVLKGEMSLVGPRPALPSEVEEFDEGLLARHDVRPGITGLWQVEARDNPSFAAYRRLDLLYVKNWSASLDTVVLVLTLQSVIARAFRSLFGSEDSPGTA